MRNITQAYQAHKSLPLSYFLNTIHTECKIFPLHREISLFLILPLLCQWHSFSFSRLHINQYFFLWIAIECDKSSLKIFKLFISLELNFSFFLFQSGKVKVFFFCKWKWKLFFFSIVIRFTTTFLYRESFYGAFFSLSLISRWALSIFPTETERMREILRVKIFSSHSLIIH